MATSIHPQGPMSVSKTVGLWALWCVVLVLLAVALFASAEAEREITMVVLSYVVAAVASGGFPLHRYVQRRMAGPPVVERER